jgi:hypothetical protein
LGKGAYGVVHRGHVATGMFGGADVPEHVAVKLTNLRGTPRAEVGDIVADDGFENEMNVLKVNRAYHGEWSPNLMRIYAGAVMSSSNGEVLLDGDAHFQRSHWFKLGNSCGITVLELIKVRILSILSRTQ